MKKLILLLVLTPLISFAQSVNSVNIEFQISETYSTGGGPGNIVSADFNSDKRLDLAVADNTGNSIAILLASGDSTFSVVNSITIINPQFIIAGYFNADTNADLAVATVYNQNYYVSIYLGAGDGATFTGTDTSYYLVGPPKCMASGDFNHDSITDLATVNSMIGQGTVSILQGLGTVSEGIGNEDSLLIRYKEGRAGFGDGGFISTSSYNAGTYPYSIIAGDFNKDDFQDIAITNLGDNTVGVYLFDTSNGNENGTYMQFKLPIIYNVGNYPWNINSCDLDKDGYLDLIVSNNGDNTISILRGKADNGTDTTFFAPTYDTIAGGPWSVAVADFNRDAILDMAITSRDSGLTIMQGQGDFQYTKSWNYHDSLSNYAHLYFPMYLFALDLNGDSLPDISLANHSYNNIVVLRDTLIEHTEYNKARVSFSSASAGNSALDVYPIPATDIIHVNSKSKIEILSLRDVQGRELLTSTQDFITVSSLSPGVYLLYITTQQGTTVKQVVITSQ